MNEAITPAVADQLLAEHRRRQKKNFCQDINRVLSIGWRTVVVPYGSMHAEDIEAVREHFINSGWFIRLSSDTGFFTSWEFSDKPWPVESVKSVAVSWFKRLTGW